MKVLSAFMVMVMLFSSHSFAVDGDFPVRLSVKNSGELDPTFYKDIIRPIKKFEICFESMDPRAKAYMYMRYLQEFHTHMPIQVSNEINDSVNAGQDGMIAARDYVTKVKVSSNSNQIAMLAILVGFGLLPFGGGLVGPMAAGTMRLRLAAYDANRVPMPEPGVLVASNLETQNRQMTDLRDNLLATFRASTDRISKVMKMLEAPDAYNLTSEDADYLRFLICGFMPKPSHVINDDRLDYITFCSSENGGKNFNRQRGMFSCQDVQRISVKEREATYRDSLAMVARTLAETVVVPDPYRLNPEGTTGRIEVKVTEFKTETKKVILGYRSPAGVRQLCTILRAREYQRHWYVRDGKRVLAEDLPLKELRLPMSVDWRVGNSKYPDSETFLVTVEGGVRSYYFNDKETLFMPSPGVDKYFKKKKAFAENIRVRDLVGDRCDE